MLEVIKELTGAPDISFANGTFSVLAKVNDRLVIDKEPMECHFTKGLDFVTISIYWEEGGYKNYRDMGLFGKMNTKWQEIKRKANWLYINGEAYKLRITL
jgi:hypothetical protein